MYHFPRVVTNEIRSGGGGGDRFHRDKHKRRGKFSLCIEYENRSPKGSHANYIGGNYFRSCWH